MATSSYQTISRYTDCSYRFRVRGIGDIRQKHREALSITRIDRRANKYSINRKVISNCDSESNNSGDGCLVFDNNECYSAGDSEVCDQSFWGDYSEWGRQTPTPASRSDTSSPSTLSIVSSEYSSIHSDVFRLSTPSSTPSPLMIRSKSKPVSRKQLLQARKQINAAHYNPEQVQQDFEQYTYGLKEFGKSRQQICDYICSGVEILSNTIACHKQEISDQALQLLTSLVEQELLDIQSIYFILQQGILLSMKSTLGRHNGDQLVVILRFFSQIVKQETRSVPFITELMFTIQLFSMIDEVLSYGTREEMFASMELYGTLLQATHDSLISSNQEPILPDMYSNTEASAYSPVSTLKRLLRPELLELFGDRYVKQANYVDEDMLKFSMSALMSSLYLACQQLQLPQGDIKFARNILDTLARMKLVEFLEGLEDNQSNCDKTRGHIFDNLREFSQNFAKFIQTFDQMLTSADEGRQQCQ